MSYGLWMVASTALATYREGIAIHTIHTKETS